MLEVAGWKLGPNGLRQNEQGRSLTLVAYERPSLSQPSEGALLVLQAARVGIQIELRTLPIQAVTDKAAKHEGDLWIYGWTMALDPDMDSPLFTRDGYRTRANVSSYLNPDVDHLFDEGRHTLDPEARKKIYRKISEIIFRDKPVIPIAYNQTRVLSHLRLQGVGFQPAWPELRILARPAGLDTDALRGPSEPVEADHLDLARLAFLRSILPL